MWKTLLVILIVWITFTLARPSYEQFLVGIDIYKPNTFVQDLIGQSTKERRQMMTCENCSDTNPDSPCRVICENHSKSSHDTGQHQHRRRRYSHQYHDKMIRVLTFPLSVRTSPFYYPWYGKTGNQAQKVYLDRTAYWINQYEQY
ncbi:hypothetical protein I4U23_012205 [Adineta vaga]|nr:hypothetical protein I4U23_012205 [Adineta vaga]